MSSSFQNKKQLKIIVTIWNGQAFSPAGENQATFEFFRASVDIDKAGGQMMGTLRAQIWGVSQADMNAITTLQWGPRSLKFNTIEVHAVDGDQDTVVFQGNIVNAWGNYQSQPDVFLQIQAQSAYFAKISSAAPRSFKGTIDVATVMSKIADSMKFVFENNKVSVSLANPYIQNDLVSQALSLAQQANIDIYIDNGILAISPRNKPRNKPIVEVGPTSGLSGYPTFDGVGVNFQMLFNPAVTFGGPIKLVTSIPRAAGNYLVASIGYKLESEKPGGAWFATVRGNQLGLVVTH